MAWEGVCRCDDAGEVLSVSGPSQNYNDSFLRGWHQGVTEGECVVVTRKKARMGRIGAGVPAEMRSALSGSEAPNCS